VAQNLIKNWFSSCW